MEFISNCTADAISKAAPSLKDGHLVAFPTETVYGLGADATNEKAVSRIYSVKGRPIGHPLIVHISSINKLDHWATNIPDYAIKLAREFWPGPMTLILQRSDLAKDFITGDQNYVGLRVPAQPIALALLKKFEELGGKGVAAPSANRYMGVSPTSADAVKEELDKFLSDKDLIIDGGKCNIGIESVIISCISSTPEILRPGIITSEIIRKKLKIDINEKSIETNIRFPGKMTKHYAPKATIKINEAPKIGDGLIALANVPTPPGVTRLISPVDMNQFTQELYSALRNADKLRIDTICILLPSTGVIYAIWDRLLKASSPHE